MPSTFADLGVPAELSRLLKNRGITEPFPIQSAALPDALAGRDICGKAPTGSGKTLAFGLAIAARGAEAVAAPRRPRSLVLVPTRELAAQVAGELSALQTRRGTHVVAIYGGAGYSPQRKALARGATTVVACPGRLEDLLAQGDVSLGDVDVVVLDEADRMADMGFMPAVKRILDRTDPARQTLLFSATLDGEVDALVRRYQRDPVRHEVVPQADEVGEVAHHFWTAARSERIGLTAALVHRHGRAIVFCRTRRGADRLTRQLGAAGVDAAAIHGNRTQAQRERALAAFAAGRVAALVATDVAARGIHVDDVPCVVHYDLPDDPKDYIHRSGRTGRAGASGTVVSLVADEHRKTAHTLQRHLGLPKSLTPADLSATDLAAPTATRPETPADPAPPNGRKPRHRGSAPRNGDRTADATADDRWSRGASDDDARQRGGAARNGERSADARGSGRAHAEAASRGGKRGWTARAEERDRSAGPRRGGASGGEEREWAAVTVRSASAGGSKGRRRGSGPENGDRTANEWSGVAGGGKGRRRGSRDHAEPGAGGGRKDRRPRGPEDDQRTADARPSRRDRTASENRTSRSTGRPRRAGGSAFDDDRSYDRTASRNRPSRTAAGGTGRPSTRRPGPGGGAGGDQGGRKRRGSGAGSGGHGQRSRGRSR